MSQRIRTRAVRAGVGTDAEHGAVIPPIHVSSTYTFAGLGRAREYDYARSGSPTRTLLANTLAELEGGAAGVVTGSGMAAIALVHQLLEPGALVLAPHDGYGGTYRQIDALHRAGRIRARFVDFTDPSDWRAAIAERPALIWLETPSNPLLRITPIAEVCAAARRAGALCAVDNTFMSPVWQRPLALGADLVVHSTTKYLNGHSDVVGGAVVTADAATAESLDWWANCLGLTPGATDCHLTLRGLRTLHARMAQHAANAERIAHLLAGHSRVATVHYPGLPRHPGHDLALRQQACGGAIVSFELHGGRLAVEAFVERLECFSLAESLGGVESLVAHPASMTHAAMDAEARGCAGIGEGLLRLSVGIEAPEDLEADLLTGLERAATAPREVGHG